LLLTVPLARRNVEKALSNAQRLAIARSERVVLDEMIDDCIMAAAEQVMVDHGEVPWDAEAFAAVQSVARRRLADVAAASMRQAAEVVVAANTVDSRLGQLVTPALRASVDDARAQLGRLVRRRFVASAGVRRLPDVVRYVRGIERRLDKLITEPMRDQQRLRPLVALEQRYGRLLDHLGRAGVTAEVIEIGWLLEELRVSEFAQVLGVATPVSPQRVAKELARYGA
jgi:ATP-dependent helicase HrpA